jgi:hypothetical protein
LTEHDQRPAVWIGHVVLETNRLDDTEEFMRTVGMRQLVKRAEFAVLEMRGGTHLVLIAKADAIAGEATFDLMVEDIHRTHQQFTELGFEPTPLEHVPPEHERFYVREPAGNRIAFFSNHVSGEPV